MIANRLLYRYRHLGRQCLGTVVVVLLTAFTLTGQDIAMGTWRAHLSYSRINHVAVTNTVVYGAAANGIVVVDRTDGISLSTLTKLNGLSGAGITAMGAEPSTGKLIVAYEDGTFDFLYGKTVKNFNPFQNSSLAGSRLIHDVCVSGTTAYLATDYGVLLFDLNRAAIQETWRDLGTGGQTLKIFQTVFRDDSVFLATENGVLAGNLGDNLLDYRFWKRYTNGDLANAVQSIATFQGRLYAAINNQGLYEHATGAWTKTSVLSAAVFTSLSSSATALYITANNGAWRMSSSNTITPITDDLLKSPQVVAEDAGGKLWIGDAQQGLVSDARRIFEIYRPNSPIGQATGRLHYYNGQMHLLGGGYSDTFTALGEPGNINSFQNGMWQTTAASIPDLTDIDFANDKVYFSSFGYGVEQQGPGANIVYTESNSTLINTNPPGKNVTITALQSSSDGLWALDYGASQPLHLLKNDGSWQAFSFPITAARYPVDMAADPYGYVWIVLDPAKGGGMLVFNQETNKYKYITDASGAGELPNIAVRSVAVDRDGLLWVGTDQGIAYFLSPTDVAIRPIYDNRFLLRDDKVTAIAIDGGNRKWIGTTRGVWLFNPTGEELIHNFTTANSPLLSNNIRDIAIQGETGEVFFSTDDGVVSFRADATESAATFNTVKIFPNPVTSRFTGLVGITGLATDAMIKITDVSGALVWQTQANGGAAQWDVRDYRGRRATTGVYLVFAATPDGAEHVVGKIAVID